MGYQNILNSECLALSRLKINANNFDFDSRLESLKGTDRVIANNIVSLSGVLTPIGGVVIFNEQQPSGTGGGSFPANKWYVRTLNNKKYDTYNFGALNTAISQFSLTQGIWLIRAEAPAYGVGKHQCRIFNVTRGEVVDYGDSSSSSEFNSSVSVAVATITIPVNNIESFQIEHRCEVTRFNDGLGAPANFGNDEVYTIVTCTKIR